MTVSTLGLNIFHYNQPQPEGVFYHFLEVFKARLETDEAPEIGRPAETKPPYPQGRPGIAQNVMLLADKPTGSIYDSLSVPLNGEPEQKPLDK